jgi:hypothetical protein
MGTSKVIRDTIARLHRAGITARLAGFTGSGHPVYEVSDAGGRARVTGPSTPGDYRAERNIVPDARRALRNRRQA